MPRSLASLLVALPLALTLAGCARRRPARGAVSRRHGRRPGACRPRAVVLLRRPDRRHLRGRPPARPLRARRSPVPRARRRRPAVSSPSTPHGHASVRQRGDASRDFAAALAYDRHYSHVSDVSTELPNAGGIEGLRALAARYRLRYLLLYTERFDDDTHLNGIAWLYPTILGMFVTPGVTVESHGLVQADLLDVRTGTVLFSVMEPVHVASKEFMIGAARAHHELQAAAAAEAAKRLAGRVTVQTNQLLAYADEMSSPGARERHPTRLLPAPVLADQTAVARGREAARRPAAPEVGSRERRAGP